MSYWPRTIEAVALLLAANYPVLTITGPRQSGKTTLCRAVFPRKPYVSLEPLDVRSFAAEDPRGKKEQGPDKGESRGHAHPQQPKRQRDDPDERFIIAVRPTPPVMISHPAAQEQITVEKKTA